MGTLDHKIAHFSATSWVNIRLWVISNKHLRRIRKSQSFVDRPPISAGEGLRPPAHRGGWRRNARDRQHDRSGPVADRDPSAARGRQRLDLRRPGRRHLHRLRRRRLLRRSPKVNPVGRAGGRSQRRRRHRGRGVGLPAGHRRHVRRPHLPRHRLHVEQRHPRRPLHRREQLAGEPRAGRHTALLLREQLPRLPRRPTRASSSTTPRATSRRTPTPARSAATR